MPDVDTRAFLLAALESLAKASPAKAAISAAEVNNLGHNLGLSDVDTLQIIRQLDAEGRIKVEWGGEVKFLPRSRSTTIHLERGATYVGKRASIGAGAAIGNNAIAAGAARNPQPTSPLQLQAIADFTAAITLLSQSMAGAKSDAQPELRKLIEETEAVLPQLRSKTSDKATLKDRLDEADKALGLLSKTASIASAAIPHLPKVLEMFQSGWNAVSILVGTL